MRTPRMLRRLDQRILPPIGRALSLVLAGRDGKRRMSWGARRVRLVMVTASALSVAVVLVTVYAATRSPRDPRASTVPQVRIGVTAGESIADYIARAESDLTTQVQAHPAGDGVRIVALVSFSQYVTAAQVPALIAGAEAVRAFTHVHLPDATTKVHDVPAHTLPGDIENAMRDQAGEIAKQARNDSDYAAATVPDTDERKRLRSQYLAQSSAEAAEAGAYHSLCACVFAVVVVATPADLATMTDRRGIRVIDPAPTLRAVPSPQNAIFAPPRPEELVTADALDGAAASDIGAGGTD
jgi:hypothetical protein